VRVQRKKNDPNRVRAFQLQNGQYHNAWSRIALTVDLVQVIRHTARLTDGIAIAKTPVSLDPRETPFRLARGSRLRRERPNS
jgi:hypothetical protein